VSRQLFHHFRSSSTDPAPVSVPIMLDVDATNGTPEPHAWPHAPYRYITQFTIDIGLVKSGDATISSAHSVHLSNGQCARKRHPIPSGRAVSSERCEIGRVRRIDFDVDIGRIRIGDALACISGCRRRHRRVLLRFEGAVFAALQCAASQRSTIEAISCRTAVS
jgi:hypothetical protein